MKDITLIPYEELQKDKQESLLNIITCENALKKGITTKECTPKEFLGAIYDNHS